MQSPTDMATYNTGAKVAVAARVTDPGTNDQLTCTIDWGDSTTSPGTVSAGRCFAEHAFAAAGLYTLTVTVADDDGAVATAEVPIVVSDDSTRVTGGGFTTQGGRASFGFVVKHGLTPEGQLQVRVGKDRFHGDSVLTFTEAGSTVTWTGLGKWNGADGYTYRVTVTDNGTGKKAPADRISITITDSAAAVVLTRDGSLTGGNISVHR